MTQDRRVSSECRQGPSDQDKDVKTIRTTKSLQNEHQALRRSYSTTCIFEAMRQSLYTIILYGKSLKNSIRRAGYLSYEKRQTLSIPNPFFPRPDTDIACSGQALGRTLVSSMLYAINSDANKAMPYPNPVPWLRQALSLTTSLPRISRSSQLTSFLRSESLEIFNK